MWGLVDGLRRLAGREDFLRNPPRAIWRRVAWRLRWRMKDKPWVLRYRKGMQIGVANDGLGALLYYQGFAEPETEFFLARMLRPGMVCVDVGAHVGAYTLLASQAVGPGGEVHAFEPNPRVFSLLQENIRRNSLRNVRLENAAVSNSMGESEYEIRGENTLSSLKAGAESGRDVLQVVRVRCTTLDSYCSALGKRPGLVKVDVEGAEPAVFLGALGLLGLPAAEAPAWVFEYSPTNYARFGYRAEELLELLQHNGFELWRYRRPGYLAPFQPKRAESRTVNLLAVKAGRDLPPGT